MARSELQPTDKSFQYQHPLIQGCHPGNEGGLSLQLVTTSDRLYKDAPIAVANLQAEGITVSAEKKRMGSLPATAILVAFTAPTGPNLLRFIKEVQTVRNKRLIAEQQSR